MFYPRKVASFLLRRNFTSPLQPLSLVRSAFLFSRMISTPTLPRLPIFEAIVNHDPNSIAVIHSLSGTTFTYGQLVKDVAEAKESLLKEASSSSIDGSRIAFLVENSYDYVGEQLVLLQLCGSQSDGVYSDSTFHPGCTFDCAPAFTRISRT